LLCSSLVQGKKIDSFEKQKHKKILLPFVLFLVVVAVNAQEIKTNSAKF
jgi:hypothetical protein